MKERNYIGIIAGISGEVIVKELHKLGYKTFVISGRKEDSGMDISDGSFVMDLKEKELIYNELIKNKIDRIILGTGHILAFQLIDFLSKKGIKVSVNPKSSLIAKDKAAYKEELIKNGILTPKYIEIDLDEKYNIQEILDKVGYPCVIKSTIDTTYPKKANTKKELEKHIENIRKTNSPIVIEQFIEGIDTTVPVCSNPKETKAILVSYYSKADACKLEGFGDDLIKGALSKEVEEKLLRFSEEVIRKTNILGMARLDIIVDKDEKFYVLECNSVMVTGVHPNQIEYGREFLERENINFAEFTVKNALEMFND
ncbi:ATP-grasp domain-containing protein [Fusobacterium russii]|uniref:ATP-grasp domain-containing protein n=1 Tax=Fusobacterium russii TaxID=854 RepID=UPI0003A70F1E|nr:ATP-grasp domain-containing protein [Fusobacterium russii]